MSLELFGVTENIKLAYTTGYGDNTRVSFDISFGEGVDSLVCLDEEQRKKFTKNYPVETFKNEDTCVTGYRVVANEGPIVVQIENLKIDGNENYDYGLAFSLDREEPQYNQPRDTLPYNIERDGGTWVIKPGLKAQRFDQNPSGEYQWCVKKAKDIGYKPTEEEKELGMEETNDNTGLMYLTFTVFKKEKVQEQPVYRGGGGVTRGSGGVTRGSGGVTRGLRGGSDTQPESVAARFGYGNSASSSSVKSEYTFAEGTEKYILPIRTRISKDSKESDINCSQHIKGASLNMIRKQTVTVPF
jgi:hypothetical protein